MVQSSLHADKIYLLNRFILILSLPTNNNKKKETLKRLRKNV